MKIDFHIEDICIDFKNNNNKFHDEIEFFLKKIIISIRMYVCIHAYIPIHTHTHT
jgi:hypothetical protein